MTETTPPTSTELRGEAQAATDEATRLARRRTEIDAEIRQLQEDRKQARLQAARNGDPIETPTLDSELKALLAEREDLPELHFTTLESAQGLWIRAEGVKIEELQQPILDARSELEAAEGAFRQAERAKKDAEAKLGSLRQTRYVSAERRKHFEAELEKLADQGVRPMAPLD